MTRENSKDASRRNVLKALGATGALAAFGGVASAQETTQRGGGGQIQIQGTPIFLGAQVEYWYGLYPGQQQDGGGGGNQSTLNLQGQENPTLNLQSGQQYTVVWINMDGQPHNFAVLDGNGNPIENTRSTIIDQQGATQAVTFTANQQMAEYYCEVHPQSMRGQVQIGGGGGQ